MTKIDDLMYWSGITASGCWDQMDDYDHSCIEHLAVSVVVECLRILSDHPGTDLIANDIRQQFGFVDHNWLIKPVPNTKPTQYMVQHGTPPARVLAAYGITT